MSDALNIEKLEQRNRQLSAIVGIAQATRAVEDDALLPLLSRLAADGTGSDDWALYLLEGETLVLASASAQSLMRGFERLPLHGSLNGEVALRGVATATALADLPEQARAGLRASGGEWLAIIPIRIQQRCAGTLALSRLRPYSADDLGSAQAIADQIATQLEKAQLHAEANRRVRLLSLGSRVARLGAEHTTVAHFVELVLQETVAALDVDSAMIHLAERGALALAGRFSRLAASGPVFQRLERMPIDATSLSGRAVLGRRTILIAPGEWPELTAPIAASVNGRYGIAAPLVAKDRVIGSFACVRRTDRPFFADEVELIEACAAHIATAIERARLFEAERSRAHDLSLINELGSLISGQLDLSAVLDIGIRHLARLAEVPQVFVMLLEGERLRVVASTVEAASGTVIEPGEPALARIAIDERRALIVNEPASDPRVSLRRVQQFGDTALLAVPMFARGAPLGSVVLALTEEGRRFGGEEVDRAVAMVNQLATAISNARLFEDLKASYAQLARAQEQLVQRERLAALGELAAVVAHEVRNPLAVIFNSLATLRREPQQQAQSEMLLDIVGEEAERLNRIVSELLAFARPTEPRLEAQSLEAVIAGATEAASSALGCRVAVEIPRPLPSFALDAQLLRQALINLMMNAVQAQPGGRVVIRAIEDRFLGRPCARVEVSDEGPGIPPAVAGQIFQPFFTTKAQGTGLGLAIVKRIVEAHGGEVQFTAGLQRGTTFTMKLPIG